MLGYIRTSGSDESRSDAYHCAECGVLITHASAAVKINGADTHSFVNPAGLHCNFMTFAMCENVLEHEDLYIQHSWFPGYGWRFLVCRNCLSHLGWKYDAVRVTKIPQGFFGVLKDAVDRRVQES